MGLEGCREWPGDVPTGVAEPPTQTGTVKAVAASAPWKPTLMTVEHCRLEGEGERYEAGEGELHVG
jgi:hypothetical protein